MVLVAGIVLVCVLGIAIWACLQADDEAAIRKGYQRENEADFQEGWRPAKETTIARP